MPNFEGMPQAKRLRRAKEFTDAALRLDIPYVLERATVIRNIGSAAASLCAETLQHEGDYASKMIVQGAYEDIHTLMMPTLEAEGPDKTLEIFTRPATLQTIRSIARCTDDKGMQSIADAYAKAGKHLKVDESGLVPRGTSDSVERFRREQRGCPFAAMRSGYFDTLTPRIAATYAEAYARDMPQTRLAKVREFLR